MRANVTTIALALLAACVARAQGGGASGDEIVRRAAERRAELRRATGAFAATFHTVSTVRIDRGGSRATFVPEGEILHESIGRLYRSGEMKRVVVDAERGTKLRAGIGRSLVEDLQLLDRYFSVDDDAIVLLNTSIASPLAADASRYYTFTAAGSSTRRGARVREIQVRPATSLYPLFEGTLWIEEGKGDVVEIDLAPSRETAIPFIETLRLVETFSPVEGGVYQPDSLSITGTGSVMAVAFGLAKADASFSFATKLSDRRMNVAIPDSIALVPSGIILADDAGSRPADYWAARGSLTTVQADAIASSALAARHRGPSFSGSPYIDYNRAGATTLGATGGAEIGPVTLGLMGGYSFGLERPLGEASLAVELAEDGPVGLTLRGGAFSQIATTTTGDKTYPRVMNSLVSATLHQDYYNFLRKDGWSAGADVIYAPFRLSATFERSRQFSIGENAQWALLTWKTKEFQDNPAIEDGSYQTMQAELASGRVSPFLKITPVEGIDLRWSLSGLVGSELSRSVDFRLAEALLSLSIPVVPTGYNPMTLTLLGAGGAGTATLPPQYQFRLRTSAATFGKPGGFVSPPKGLYGGTEYIALGGEFNLTDLPWRAIGLPTYNGRGVELILGGGSARYRQRHSVGYVGTGDEWYSEAGLALSRIPLFLTDLVTGRVDARWGLGPLGTFNANFTFVVPL